MAMEYLMQQIGHHYSQVLALCRRSLRRVFTIYVAQLSKFFKKLFQLARNLYPSAFICVHLGF
jgi:YesN/AraC family two-component response regulator